jgi:hypothetical protein
MPEIVYYVEDKRDLRTIEHGILARDIHGDLFNEMLRVFTEHRPHLLFAESLAPECKAIKPGEKGFFIASDLFKTEVKTDGAVFVFCQYETKHPDGARVHSYMLRLYS